MTILHRHPINIYRLLTTQLGRVHLFKSELFSVVATAGVVKKRWQYLLCFAVNKMQGSNQASNVTVLYFMVHCF